MGLHNELTQTTGLREYGAMRMLFDLILGGTVTIGLLVYLIYVLIRIDRF